MSQEELKSLQSAKYEADKRRRDLVLEALDVALGLKRLEVSEDTHKTIREKLDRISVQSA